MPQQFDLIVFDWDGTLQDSTEMIVRSLQRACEDIGAAIPSREQSLYVIGLGLHDALETIAPNLAADRKPALIERYRFHYLSRDADLVLFEGVAELLGDLQRRGHRLAVATGKSRNGLDRALATTGLSSVFEASRCADQTHSKPHPAMLLELMNETGVVADRTLMIGDTTHDLQMAINAGVSGLGVAYGAHEPERLRELTSRGVMYSVAELSDWLRTHA